MKTFVVQFKTEKIKNGGYIYTDPSKIEAEKYELKEGFFHFYKNGEIFCSINANEVIVIETLGTL